MKAKKVYEFINPKTDEYDLEDNIELGPNVFKRKKIEDWFKKWAPDADYDIDDDLHVNVFTSIDLSSTDIEHLPIENLTIQNSLILRYCENLKSLPDNLTVVNLFLSGSSITELPKNLKITNNLYVNQMTVDIKIPKDAEIQGIVIGKYYK